MKNFIVSLLLIILFSVNGFAQQLEDGKHKWNSEIGLEVILYVEEDGESIASVYFIHKKDTLIGSGHWVDAPRHSDMEGGGWYEALLKWEDEDKSIYVEMDVQNYHELKITQNVEGVDVVMLMDRVYKPCRH